MITRHTTVGFESRYPVLTYLYFGILSLGNTPNPAKFPLILQRIFNIPDLKPHPNQSFGFVVI